MTDAYHPHPFRQAPHATLVRLSLPVLVSLAAEPITGAVDTAFVARLGAPPLAALGVGATLLPRMASIGGPGISAICAMPC